MATPKKVKSSQKTKPAIETYNSSLNSSSYYYNLSLALQGATDKMGSKLSLVQQSPKKPLYSKVACKSPSKNSKTPLHQRDKISAGYFAPSDMSPLFAKYNNQTA